MATNAPKLTPIKDNSDDMMDYLSDIDDKLGSFVKDSKSKKPSKNDPLESLKESVESFTKSIDDGVSVSGLSTKDMRNYLKKQNEISKNERTELKDTIESLRKNLFEKKELTEEDKQSLSELNEIQKNLKSYGVKQDSILSTMVKKISEPLQKGFGTLGSEITTGILGPLNLITQPMEELFGFKLFDLLGEAVGGAKEYFDKGKKVKPKISDIKKSNPEIVWLADELTGKEEDDKTKKGLLDGLFSADMAKNLLPLLAKGASVAAIAAGLVMATLDGIAAVGKASEWGVDKDSAFIGGFFGGTGSGLDQAVKKGAQFGLMGAGTGFLIGGPVGAIVGGLIGAAFGAIMGYIGGEELAKQVQSLKEWFGKFIKTDFIVDMTDFLTSSFKETFSAVSSSGKILGDILLGNKSFKDGMAEISKILLESAGSQIKMFYEKNPLGQLIEKYINNPIEDLFRSIGDFFVLLTDPKVFTSLFKGKDTFNKTLADAQTAQQKKHFRKETTDSASYASWLKDIDKRKKSGEAFTQKTDEDWFKLFYASKEGKSFIENYNDSHLTPLNTEFVNDAIIHPSGKIIRPSPDDTIIATKSPVSGFDSANMGMNLDQLTKAMEDSGKGNEIVMAIEKLVDIMKNKSFNNIIQNNDSASTDFNALRMIY